MRGIKTLGVRIDRHSSNAHAIAEALVGAPGVERVYYPGLESHPGHELAARQMSAFGGMLSVALAGGRRGGPPLRRVDRDVPARRVARRRRVADRLPDRDDPRVGAGTELEVPDNVVRLSVGIEDVDDLLADVRQALDRAQA